MSVDERIVNLLTPFGLDIDNGVSTSREDKYFVFNYSTVPNVFADDSPWFENYLVQVHLFAPLNENISELKVQVKRALLDAGFTWPSTTDASDENSRHIVFECNIVEHI